MKVFISWSGGRSKAMGEYLLTCMKNIFPNIEIFFSPEIPVGEDGFNRINQELSLSDAGIFLFTRENIQSTWMAFEAGAIFHNQKKGKIISIFVDDKL